MSNTELIKELRSLTQAGMKDCKDALEEAFWDLQKAIDIVKVKGLNIVSGREGKVASEGRVDIESNGTLAVMVEVNCQTDFVANSKEFANFVSSTKHKLYDNTIDNMPFLSDDVEAKRKEIVSSTKENIVVRRWWSEQSGSSTVKVFSYQHSNNKIGVIITMQAPSDDAANSLEFKALGEDLAMQIAAMNPLSVSSDRISSEELDRQKAIFETQLKEDVKPKPEAMWPKIIDGKTKKWYQEVCLLEQESVVVPKTTVKQVIANLEAKLGGKIEIINFIRCQVGSGIEVKAQASLAREIENMTGIKQPKDHKHIGQCCNGNKGE